MTTTVGLDVGGAHLKVARIEHGRPVAVTQIVCPLWQGLPHLDTALDTARIMLAGADRIAITMTGELSDLFTNRQEGVSTLVGKLDFRFGDAARFWMGRRGFGNADAAVEHYRDVASTNFLATAAFVARHHGETMLIDMGSTTTDIIAIRDGAPAAQGLTDADRLATSELVYTGLTRTAVMGVTTAAPFRGQTQGLCREYLATMADVRRILDELPDGLDLHATADGRGKSVEESVARLARMFGRDTDDGSSEDWRAAAAAIAEAQMQSIADGFAAVASRSGLPETAPIVAAGIGAGVLASSLGTQVQREIVFFGNLTTDEPILSTAATLFAPAVAVALLAH